MIKRVRVKGYKSLKDVEVELRPLTVFIGPNASGKSNFFDALNLLSHLVTTDNLDQAFNQHRGTPIEAFYYGNEGVESLLSLSSAEFSFDVVFELSTILRGEVNSQTSRLLDDGISFIPTFISESNSKFRYGITVEIKPTIGGLQVTKEYLKILDQNEQEIPNESLSFIREGSTFEIYVWRNGLLTGQGLPNNTTFMANYPRLLADSQQLRDSNFVSVYAAIKEELVRWRFYQFEPAILRTDAPIRKTYNLASNGSDLAAFYNTLQREESHQFRFLERTLQTLFDIEGIEVGHDKQGMLQIQVVEKGVPYSIRVVSEGTLRMLGLLAILSPMALSKTTVLGYEEPENGVHPRRLKLIADLLNNAAEANEHLQILINTHSPVLPEYFEPDSLIVCRKEGRESKFIPFSHFQMNGHGVDLAFDDDEPETTFTQRVIRGDFDV